MRTQSRNVLLGLFNPSSGVGVKMVSGSHERLAMEKLQMTKEEAMRQGFARISVEYGGLFIQTMKKPDNHEFQSIQNWTLLNVNFKSILFVVWDIGEIFSSSGIRGSNNIKYRWTTADFISANKLTSGRIRESKRKRYKKIFKSTRLLK